MYDKENAIPDDELYLDHLNCGGEGVAVADTRGVVQSVSPAFGRLMGLKAPELVGRHLENLWQETSCEPMADVWPVLLSTGYWQGQVHCPRTEPLLFTINVAINQQGTVSHYVITCRKQNKNANHTEESLCAPESAVLAHQKLVSLTAMSAGVAHEIAQPLNAIKVLADGMLFWHKRGHSLPQGRVIDKIENISQQADRINSIIKHIRSLASTGNTLELSPCSVNTAVENALDLLGRQLSSHGIVVKMELADNLPPILGALRRLEEAIINLLVNARQALDEVSRPDKIITCLTRTNRSKVILDISDNAYGIDAERKKLLFEPFFTTKSGQQGMGLGLSIVQSIVAAFKGHIYAYTNDQGGATFRIELPALKAPTGGDHDEHSSGR